MKTLEQETASITEAANQYTADTYNYDYSSNESHYDGAYGYDGSYGSDSYDSTATTPSTLSASAPQDAESHAGAIEGTVAQGSEPAVTNGASAHAEPHAPDPHVTPAPTAPHNA
jgi:hypothetical protein